MPLDDLERTLSGVAIVAVAYGALFGLAEILRRLGAPGERTRTIVHVASAIFALGLPYLFQSPWPVAVLAVVFASTMLVSERAGLLGSIHDVPRRTVGATLFPLGIAAAFALTGGHAPTYPVAILALGLGDPAASIAGRRFARRYVAIWGSPRSLEGMAAACVVSSVVTATVLLVAGGPDPPPLLATSAAVGLAVALAEATSPRGVDNVAIPIVAALVFDAAWSPWRVALAILALAAVTIVGVAWRRSVAIRSIHDVGPTR